MASGRLWCSRVRRGYSDWLVVLARSSADESCLCAGYARVEQTDAPQLAELLISHHVRLAVRHSRPAMADSNTDRLGPGLLDLPSALLQRILKLALEDNGISRLSLLHGWGKFVATQVAPQILLESLTIQDDDQLLLDAEELARRTDESEAMRLQRPVAASTALAAVWLDSNKAKSVRRLRIIAPTPVDCTSSTSSPPLGVDFAPLEDTSFLLLLSKLQHLTRFTWSASRLPSLHLCQALGQACKELTHFTFELKTELDSSAIQQEGLSSPRVGSGASNIAGGAPPQLRWDANDLSALPITLSSLSLSNLSQSGTRELAATLPSFPALDSLELARTIFVDDALLTEIAASAKKLRRFKIREMTGTKLSDAGLAEVLGECVELEELVLDCIEGESRPALLAIELGADLSR